MSEHSKWQSSDSKHAPSPTSSMLWFSYSKEDPLQSISRGLHSLQSLCWDHRTKSFFFSRWSLYTNKKLLFLWKSILEEAGLRDSSICSLEEIQVLLKILMRRKKEVDDKWGPLSASKPTQSRSSQGYDIGVQVNNLQDTLLKKTETRLLDLEQELLQKEQDLECREKKIEAEKAALQQLQLAVDSKFHNLIQSCSRNPEDFDRHLHNTQNKIFTDLNTPDIWTVLSEENTTPFKVKQLRDYEKSLILLNEELNQQQSMLEEAYHCLEDYRKSFNPNIDCTPVQKVKHQRQRSLEVNKLTDETGCLKTGLEELSKFDLQDSELPQQVVQSILTIGHQILQREEELDIEFQNKNAYLESRKSQLEDYYKVLQTGNSLNQADAKIEELIGSSKEEAKEFQNFEILKNYYVEKQRFEIENAICQNLQQELNLKNNILDLKIKEYDEKLEKLRSSQKQLSDNENQMKTAMKYLSCKSVPRKKVDTQIVLYNWTTLNFFMSLKKPVLSQKFALYKWKLLFLKENKSRPWLEVLWIRHRFRLMENYGISKAFPMQYQSAKLWFFKFYSERLTHTFNKGVFRRISVCRHYFLRYRAYVNQTKQVIIQNLYRTLGRTTQKCEDIHQEMKQVYTQRAFNIANRYEDHYKKIKKIAFTRWILFGSQQENDFLKVSLQRIHKTIAYSQAVYYNYEVQLQEKNCEHNSKLNQLSKLIDKLIE